MMQIKRKKPVWCCFMVLLVVLLGGCGSTTKLGDMFDEATVEAEAMKAIEFFNARDYQSIIDMGDENLKAAIDAETFASQGDPYLDKDGAFQEITKKVFAGSQDKETGANYGGVTMIGVYENGKIQFTIGFNEEMQLVQFVIR